ncbi:MAG TPA: hypothetical protein VGI12_13675 [Vicinamibacterales bacterium]|jgi:hypothetical protein
MTRVFALGAAVLIVAAQAPATHAVLLRSTGGLPAHVAGAFENPLAFQQTDAGVYFVFDRRAHAVYSITHDTTARLVNIGAEPGRVLDPSAFDIDPADGSFVVADAPLRRQRVQVFTASGGRLGGFTMAAKEVARVTLDNVVLNGIGSIQFTGETVLVNQPETGALVSEFSIYGQPKRSFGQLRATAQEADPNVHLALNAGLPLVDPTGGFYFVFVAGVPMFRKYDAKGTLLFERHVEGAELDDYLRALPARWPTRPNGDGDLLPLVLPAIRAAGVDRQGRLWIALMQPYTYVYEPGGEKIRVVQFKGADILSPSSLFFSKDGRILVTPGCYEFRSPGF